MMYGICKSYGLNVISKVKVLCHIRTDRHTERRKIYTPPIFDCEGIKIYTLSGALVEGSNVISSIFSVGGSHFSPLSASAFS